MERLREFINVIGKYSGSWNQTIFGYLQKMSENPGKVGENTQQTRASKISKSSCMEIK